MENPIQPISAGLLVGVVGFASTFAVVLKGLEAVGANESEAASGLLVLLLAMAVVAVLLSLTTRMPISIAWSTPGAALLVATGLPAGGFPAAVGAFMITGALIVAAGLWRPFGRAVAAIPVSLANAMLAGILLELCVAPVKAVGAMPALALPIVIAWALAWRFVRPYAVPIAVLVTAVIVVAATPVAPAALADLWPRPVFVAPTFSLKAVISISLPLFIVTMASQNVPGLAVLSANGYRPSVAPVFVTTGLATGVIAMFGGQVVNLAAITAALCAGPDAHVNPTRRYIASVTAGLTYGILGLFSSFATAFVAASPPLLIEAVAGLALLGSLGGALQAAVAREEDRLPAVLTFLTTASGVSFFGVGAPLWGLVAGGALVALARLPRTRP